MWHYRTLKRSISLACDQEKQRIRIEFHEESHDTNINIKDMNDDDEESDEIESDNNSDDDMKTELFQIMYASKWLSNLSFNQIMMNEEHFVKNSRIKIH